MPLTRNSYGLQDTGKFHTALRQMERYFVGIPAHPSKMPLPLMLERLIKDYNASTGGWYSSLFRDIPDSQANRVIQIHRVALGMMNRIMKEQIVPGEPVIETLLKGVRQGQGKQIKLFNLAVLHIITFPLFQVYSLVPEYIYAGQNVKGSLQYRGGGRRKRGAPEVKDYDHRWNGRFGVVAIRTGKPGMVKALTFYRWFVDFFKTANLPSWESYIAVLTSDQNRGVRQKVSVAALQFLSISRLRPRGGLPPPKKARKKEM